MMMMMSTTPTLQRYDDGRLIDEFESLRARYLAGSGTCWGRLGV